jgi:hypothetical protein
MEPHRVAAHQLLVRQILVLAVAVETSLVLWVVRLAVLAL